MTEKEKLQKASEQFSSAILYVATAVYIAVCAMVMGGLAGTQPTFVMAFLTFFREYGAIIAGLPVLIAVLVAKQQLDANRRQHVATVKLTFRTELDALQKVQNFAYSVIHTSQASAAIIASLSGNKGVLVPRPAGSELRLIKETLPYSISSLNTLTAQLVEQANEYSKDKPYPDDGVEDRIKEAKKYARQLLKEVQVEHNRLSEFWS